MEESGQVVEVGPEEDPARGSGSEWETEEPLEWGFGAAPEPAGFADFGGGGEEGSGEDCGGDEGHGEAVYGRDWAERDGPARSEDEAQ